MIQTLLVMAALLGVLLGGLGLILLSDRLKTTNRRRLEALCKLVFYMGASLLFAFNALDGARREDWVTVAIFSVVAINMAVIGFFSIRRHDAIRASGRES